MIDARPPRVEYRLTDDGRRLRAVLDALAAYARRLRGRAADRPRGRRPPRRGGLPSFGWEPGSHASRRRDAGRRAGARPRRAAGRSSRRRGPRPPSAPWRRSAQRIARELHDVIAHSVSVMTVQAGAVRRLLHPDQERERLALEAIESTGREALTEMRRLVGLLREQGATPDFSPQPSMRAVDVLVGTICEAGLPVELDRRGRADRARARRRPRRLPRDPGGAHERAQVRRARARMGHRPLARARARARDRERRQLGGRRRRHAATGWWGFASASRSSEARSSPALARAAGSS